MIYVPEEKVARQKYNINIVMSPSANLALNLELERLPTPRAPLSNSSEITTNNVLCGDCLTILRYLPADSIDCVITSPPYFQQRNYNGVGMGQENEFNNYIESLLEGFAEILRVIKPTGNILYNIGDKISQPQGLMLIPYRFAIEALRRHSHLNLINDITWIKKNPTPRQFNRRLVSATEPFFHFAKNENYYYSIEEYMEKKQVEERKPSHKLGQGYLVLLEKSSLTREQQEKARCDIIKAINEVKNREIVGFRVKIKGIHAPAFGGQEGGRQIQMDQQGYTIIKLKGKRIKKDYIETAVESLRTSIKHPAVFPLSLIQELVQLACPKGGIVLDPYCGSGTTLIAAKKENRKYIGIDINPEYCSLTQERLDIY